MGSCNSGGKGGGEGWGGGGGGAIDILNTDSLISARERQRLEVDETLQTFKDMNDEYGYQVEDLQIATLSAKDASVMAYYDGANIAFNETYFNKRVMEGAYARCVQDGYHPSQGNKTALQAVASHEIGHALTDKAIARMGTVKGDSAEAILREAQKAVGHKGKLADMASKISGYAKESARECIAEATADVYCNGKNAHKYSQAIVNVMNKYLKS